MRCSFAAVALVASLAAACGDTAVVVTVGGDLVNGDGLDTICLAVDDADPGGGEFARVYRLAELADAGELTLTVEPGAAAAGVAAVRGYRGGIELARDRRAFEFDGVSELSLLLDACPAARGGSAVPAGSVTAAPGARAAISFGRGGSLVVAVGGGDATAYRAGAGGLVPAGATLPAPPSELAQLIAFDADGDCDDDLLLVGAPGLALWRRDGADTFTEVPGAFAGAGNAAAAVVADVDADGDLDVVAGAGSSLALYRNDGTGELAADGGAIPGGYATDVTALAAGDLDGDGHVDLVVGQGGSSFGVARVLLDDAAGEGRFVAAPAALPELPLMVRAAAIADVDADGFADALLGVAGGAMHAYVNRGDGRLEDRSFVVLPDQPGDVTSIAAADWDGDCLTDLVLGFAGGDAVGWRGTANGVLVAEPLPEQPAMATAIADVDDDGDRDALLVGAGGEIEWVSR